MTLTASNHVPTILARAALAARDAVIIDLRSPAEFAEDHLPGAHNVPLFNNAERAIVGTLYSRESPDAALAEGRELVRAHIDALIGEIAELAHWKLPAVDLASRLDEWTAGSIEALDRSLASMPCEVMPEKPLVLHCWRGGLRSRSVTSFVRALGLERAVALDGGYKAYREWVRASLDAWRAPPMFVLRGFTGVGKTLVLRELEALRPGWSFDLEALAGHRGSILGGVGLEPCTQKTFESRVLARTQQGFPTACVVEGEGRKVGNAALPPRVWAGLDAGTNFELTASLGRRVDVLMLDYLRKQENRAAIAAQLPFIEQRLGRVKYDGALTGLFASGQDRELVELLLERYYDPLYRQSEKRRVYAERFDAEDPARAALEIAHWIDARR